MSVGKAWEYFTRFPYLPKLTSRGVLDDAIRELPMATLLENDEFAIAESFDEKSGKYRNIILPLSNVQCFAITDATLILDHSIASAQLEDKTPLPVPTDGTGPVLPDPSPVVGPLRLEASISASSEYNRLLMNLSRDILALLEAEGVSTSLDVRLEINEMQNMSEASLRALKENLQSLGFRWAIN
jgi:hypothetical protein